MGAVPCDLAEPCCTAGSCISSATACLASFLDLICSLGDVLSLNFNFRFITERPFLQAQCPPLELPTHSIRAALLRQLQTSGAGHQMHHPRPVMPSSVAPVAIRMQDLQAAFASSGQLLGPTVAHQNHPYFAQSIARPAAAQMQEGGPPQGFQQLLGMQQLTQYHQRGLLQGQQSKAAMGQQGSERGGAQFRPSISLAPLPVRPNPQGVGPDGSYPGGNLSHAQLPLSGPYMSFPHPQAGGQPWLPQNFGPSSLPSQHDVTSGAFHPSTRPLDMSTPVGSVPPPQGQEPYRPSPHPQRGLTNMQQSGGLRMENSGGPSGPGTLQPFQGGLEQQGMPQLPGIAQGGKAAQQGNLHFIPPGSAVIQPGPPMIHPGTTYNDTVCSAFIDFACHPLPPAFVSLHVSGQHRNSAPRSRT